MAAGVQDRNERAVEYLHLLRTLALELEKAMKAIVQNCQPEFEDSVSNQQMLSSRLRVLADELCVPLEAGNSAPRTPRDDDRMREIVDATEALQKLNRRYAALLKYSSRSVALMVSLFASLNGQFPEASGSRPKYQTWSCRM